MKLRTTPLSLPEAVTDALETLDLVYDSIRKAQKRISASHQVAQHDNERRVASAIFPIMERLQIARGSTTFARMRLREIARNIGARERRRNRTRVGRKRSRKDSQPLSRVAEIGD